MPKQYSIAEARTRLPSIVHAVDVGSPVELTRRGRPVAVLMSLAEYRRLTAEKKGGFWERLQAFRREADLEAIWTEGDPWEGVRDQSPDRHVEEREQLPTTTGGFSTAYDRFLRTADLGAHGLHDEFFADLRDQTSGRDIDR